MKKYEFEPIGVLQTCFKEKFGIPRQPGLVTGAQGVLKLNPDPFLKQAVRELESFTHLWVIFVFHQHDARNWKPSIRPPRLGGAKKVGVLASRSPHRPNPIGLSAVRLDRIDLEAPDGIEIHVSGVDVLDGTPVLDIKPYIPYADSIPDAGAGWADQPIARVPVEFTETALRAIAEREGRGDREGSGGGAAATAVKPGAGAATGPGLAAAGRHDLRALIVEMLSLDPRPAFQQRRMPPSSPEAQGTRYGFMLLEYDVKWEIRDGKFWVLDLVDLPGEVDGEGGTGPKVR